MAFWFFGVSPRRERSSRKVRGSLGTGLPITAITYDQIRLGRSGQIRSFDMMLMLISENIYLSIYMYIFIFNVF